MHCRQMLLMRWIDCLLRRRTSAHWTFLTTNSRRKECVVTIQIILFSLILFVFVQLFPILPSFAALPRLSSLKLAGNQISNKVILSRQKKKWNEKKKCEIEFVLFFFCKKGISALAVALKSNGALRLLDISNNKFGFVLLCLWMCDQTKLNDSVTLHLLHLPQWCNHVRCHWIWQAIKLVLKGMYMVFVIKKTTFLKIENNYWTHKTDCQCWWKALQCHWWLVVRSMNSISVTMRLATKVKTHFDWWFVWILTMKTHSHTRKEWSMWHRRWMQKCRLHVYCWPITN